MNPRPRTPNHLQLGLIGDNIARSRAPLLHRLAGKQTGLSVNYDLIVPKDLGKAFDAVFEDCAAGGYRGVNITYPYKERAAERVDVADPFVRELGAVNTVVFDQGAACGFNTDYSGFIEAYRRVRGETGTGATLLIGTGGVGRAVAFGLVTLGAAPIRLVDCDTAKAKALAGDLRRGSPGLDVSVHENIVEAARDAQGIINCTPLGMVGHEGSPLPRSAMEGAGWAFDAVYTPSDTKFLADAEAEGLTIISGWELFFYQGVHAWDIFSGYPLDAATLRRDLLSDGNAP